MLLGFFDELRRYRVPVSLRELIDLLAMFRHRLIFADLDDFYFLSRTALVKDEKYYDRFDQAFADYFEGLDSWEGVFELESLTLMDELLRHVRERNDRSEAEVKEVVDSYREAVRELREQRAQEAAEDEDSQREAGESGQEGDNGDGDSGEQGEGDSGEQGEEGDQGNQGEEGEEGDEGTEGEGDAGEKGEGVSDEGEDGERTETTDNPKQQARKVWLAREFQEYDPDVELGTRNLKMALRRLRKWARESAELELDLHDTIHSTAANGGILDIKMVPERHNAVKVILLMDVGGSMDPHIELCGQLFSAARSEFKHLENYYFHNFIYESLWPSSERRFEDKVSTWHLPQFFPADHKLIIVGDADMGRHEIQDRGGSVEHFNAEPGEIWFRRLTEHFRSVVWLNPVTESRWKDSQSIQMIRKRVDDQMYFLSDAGLEQAMKYLMR